MTPRSPRVALRTAVVAVLSATSWCVWAQDTAFTVADLTTQQGENAVTVIVSMAGTTVVTEIDLTITYPSSPLTYVNTATSTATSGWALTQPSESPAGTLNNILLSTGGAGATTGDVAILTFNVSSTAGLNNATAGSLAVSAVLVNSLSTSGVHTAGALKLIGIVYGDVTGSGTITAYDASYVLQAAADMVANAVSNPLPIEGTPPIWGGFGLAVAPTVVINRNNAGIVANVDGTANVDNFWDGGTGDAADDPDIGSADAVDILKYAVGLITTFTAGAPPAPSWALLAFDGGNRLRATSTSERPGSLITVSLDLGDIPDLYAGELRLDFDPSVVAPMGLRVENAPQVTSTPLLASRVNGSHFGIAFGWADPIVEESPRVEVVFEADRRRVGPLEGVIRASHLRLNRTKLPTDFAYRYRIEPFRSQVLANYPNPFNPETWIPFELAEAGSVTVRIYALGGSVVRTLELGYREQGLHTDPASAAYWDGRNETGESVSSGVYVYELTAGQYRGLRRMVIAK